MRYLADFRQASCLATSLLGLTGVLTHSWMSKKKIFADEQWDTLTRKDGIESEVLDLKSNQNCPSGSPTSPARLLYAPKGLSTLLIAIKIHKKQAH